MTERHLVKFDYKKGCWKCPFCNYRSEQLDLLYGHIYRDHRNKIIFQNQPLDQFENKNGEIVSDHKCDICLKDSLSKKDHVIRHLRTHDGKELDFSIEIEEIERKKITFSKRQIMTPRTAYKFLIEIGGLQRDVIAFDKKEAPIKGNFLEIREYLGLYEPKQVCDQLVSQISNEYYFAEFTSTDIRTAISQLKSTIKYCHEYFSEDIPYAILYIKRFNEFMKKMFRRNMHTWILENKNRTVDKQIYIRNTPIFIAQENDKMKDLFKKICLYLTE